MAELEKKWLVPDWRQAWRWLSVQFATLIVALSALEVYLPQLQDYMPERWYSYLALAIIVGRVINQVEGHNGRR